MRSRLKELRGERAMTQADLGARVGVTRQAIIAIESGKHAPSLDLAFRIAAVFGCSVEDVFENPHVAAATHKEELS